MALEELAQNLRRFYGDLVSKCGEEYSKSSLINIRAGLNRHLTSPPWNRQINLMKDRSFQAANQVLCGILRDYRSRGKDVSQHKEAVTAADVDKIYSSGTLSDKTPRSLQYKVYFELSLHCAHRGCEGLRELKKDSFIVKSDENGRHYVTLAYHELEKNHQGLKKKEGDRDPRMYEQIGASDCPVASYRKYLSKLNPACEAFFQRPISTRRVHDDIWYGISPVGKNTLSNFMKEISKKAQLSRIYTNHCLRATSATVLDRNAISPLDICSVTGHRNVESVKSYVQGPSDDQRYNMSRLLHNHGKTATAVVTPSADPHKADDAPEAGDTAESLVTSVTPSSMASLNTPAPGQSNVISMSSNAQNVSLEKLTHSLFSGVTFAANSNPVFNININ